MADFIVNLQSSTELEAVNEMLAAIGVAPVADLGTTTSRDAILAKTALSTVAREVLLERWRFNTEFGHQILPSQEIEWIADIDGAMETLSVFEVPVRGQSTTKQRALLRWKLADHINVPGSGFVNQAMISAALTPPTSKALVDGAPRQITAISVDTAALVTSVGHKFINKQSVVFAGTNSTPVIDGTRVVTVIDDDTFTVPVTTTVTGSVGTATNETPSAVFFDTVKGRDGWKDSERDAIYIDATWSVDFVDMPMTARDYITKRAARRFAQTTVGSQEVVGFAAQDESIARRNLRREQGLPRKFNILNNPQTRLAHGRTRFVQNSQPDSAQPRGGTA